MLWVEQIPRTKPRHPHSVLNSQDRLGGTHSTYSDNWHVLLVLLGKNRHFEALGDQLDTSQVIAAVEA